MRTIKFRGKDSNGNWHYGDLEHSPIGKFCRIHEYRENGFYKWHADVDPETIGQYTGLTDKNGKEIYEGDILKWYEIGHSDHDVLEPPEDYIKEFIGVVEFLAGGFAISREEFPSPIHVAYLTEDFQANDDDMFKWVYNTDEYPNITIDDMYICEVVDNIHDNPDLLEKGGNQ